MNAITPRRPIRTNDADGTPIILVPVHGSVLPAVIEAEDFDRLAGIGITPRWIYNQASATKRYVRCGHPRKEASGGLATIARLLMEAPAGVRVRYYDGDTLNLRRGNLYLCGSLAERALGREAGIIAARSEAR